MHNNKAYTAYKKAASEASDLLLTISDLLDHERDGAARKMRSIHYGHAGDMELLRGKLREIHDRMLGLGEYAE